MDVYGNCPVLQNEFFCLRPVIAGDAGALLKVYSDPLAVPFFNSDNCHGDDFHYQTLERMEKAIRFWDFSYRNRYFVRWAIVDRSNGDVVGTVEIFRREAEDAFTDTALLRLDLRSDYEKEEFMQNIMHIIIEYAYSLFNCKTITTKAVPAAVTRRTVLEHLGFRESQNTLKGQDGMLYNSYFVRRKNV